MMTTTPNFWNAASRAFVVSARSGRRVAACSSRASSGVAAAARTKSYLPRCPATTTTFAQRRWASTQATGGDDYEKARSIAVLGAGLSGLCNALFLARTLLKEGKSQYKKHPYRIVLYEASDRLGGWVHSERLQLPPPPQGSRNGQEAAMTDATGTHDNTALFERGPRSIRVNHNLGPLAMMHLIASLDLGDQVISVPKSAPSAQNRLLYHGGRLHTMPTSILDAARHMLDSSHPIRKAKLYRLVRLFKNVGRYIGSRRAEVEASGSRIWPDESIEAVGEALFGVEDKSPYPDGTPCVTGLDYLVTSVLHGIYAADTSKLSFQVVFPALYQRLQTALAAQTRADFQRYWNDRDAMYDDLIRDGQKWAVRAKKLHSLRETFAEQLLDLLGDEVLLNMAATSVVSFKDGIQTLTDKVAEECRKLGVEVRTGAKVDGLSLESGKKAKITANGKTEQYDRVLSTLPSASLKSLLKDEPALSSLPALDFNPSATVCVINVAVPKWTGYEAPPAFGFLLPRACALEGDNTLGLLGVVFDSQAVPGQDDCTKLTMMIGGPYWKPGFEMYDLLNNTDGVSKANAEAAALDRALEVLARHMGVTDKDTFKAPFVLKRLTVQHDCIPTFAPGHVKRIHELRDALADDDKYAALTVSGASFTGLAMNDIVLNAQLLTLRMIDADLESHPDNVTGLEIVE